VGSLVRFISLSLRDWYEISSAESLHLLMGHLWQCMSVFSIKGQCFFNILVSPVVFTFIELAWPYMVQKNGA